MLELSNASIFSPKKSSLLFVPERAEVSCPFLCRKIAPIKKRKSDNSSLAEKKKESLNTFCPSSNVTFVSALKHRLMTLEDFSYLFGKDNKMKIWRASHIVHFALVRHFTNCVHCIGLFTIPMTNSIAFILQSGGGDFL